MPPKRKKVKQRTASRSKGGKRKHMPKKGTSTSDKTLAKKQKLDSDAVTCSSVKREVPRSDCNVGDNSNTNNSGAPVKDVKKGVSSSYVLLDHLKDKGWRDLLQDSFKEQYFQDLQEKLNEEVKNNEEIFPPQELVFNALNLTPFNQVNVVILGQDPYHDNGQAHGLSFSVPHGVKVPSSLRNIYKELETDIKGFVPPDHGNLQKWAEQGILLLNATLTVRAHLANSHAKFGWQKLTDTVISQLSQHSSSLVFILWGAFAHKKEKFIQNADKHAVIKSAHPSGLSFFRFRGCKCFSETNKMLKKFGKKPIDWSL